ncbi:MAG: FtsW/RodA/SpoVE family cell cycle protein [Paludibacteraceae bacterium]|nr:FtsW/RodA/SpoVE family cell cycle protein [Paludibacteraceae bacterium]
MNSKPNFGKAAVWMLVATFLIICGFVRLYNNQKPYLDEVERLQDNGQSMNLDVECKVQELATLLMRQNILTDQRDANATASHIVSLLANSRRKAFKNLGSLNIAVNSIPAAYADTAGGMNLKARVKASKALLGINDEYLDWLEMNDVSSFFHETDSSSCHIIATVRDEQTHNGLQGVPVRLKRHFYINVEEDQMAADSTVAYLMTDSEGRVEFVVQDGYYSIVPICEGFEYGASKGSVSDMLQGGKHVYGFFQKEHRIPIFAPADYKEIKKGPVITVRTPGSYLNNLRLYAILLLSAWWVVFFLTGIIGRRRNVCGDMLLFPLIMVLNSIGVLALIGASNPVLDRPLGFEMVQASLLGLSLMCVFSNIHIAKIYASGYSAMGRNIPFEPFAPKYKGVTYLIVALLLILLLALFGTAPVGSTAKINLFFLQPSELCKFLIVIFMASYFAENATALRKFSDKADKVSVPIQIRKVAIIATGIIVVSLLYMGALSDMGPALVLLVSFVFMYSLARGDFGHLLIGVFTFVALTLLANTIWGTNLSVILAAVLWLILWLGIYLLAKKRVYESAIFMNLLFVLFVAGGPILGAMGFTHQAERLESRLAMTGSGVWDNTNVLGGDQVAEAIWAYSTGGYSGQGVGLGNENLIPAYHTDLIMATIGEQMGWRMLFLVIVLMGLLLFRAIRAGKKSGHPFSFYLAFGIGIVTVVQFLIVGLGSTGLIPLTGIAVPFLSYAKTSVVLNMVAFGIIVAISREKAGQYQEEDVKKYKTSLASSCLSYATVGGILAIVLSGYMMFNRDATLVRPGLFTNNAGIRTYVYNPRIQVLIDKLQMETIYDRNGYILATSDIDKARYAEDSLSIVLGGKMIGENTTDTRAKRYYPFGMHTFFMTGDYNDKLQWNSSVSNPYGLNAENRYLARLRGFDNLKRDAKGRAIIQEIPILAYKPSRFLPAFKRNDDYRVAEYDYSELRGMLKGGIAGHREIKDLTREEASPVNLTVDAILQAKLQNKLSEYVSQSDVLNRNLKLRISVVVLKANNGDLLCSSNYPLPQKEILDSLERNNVYVYNERNPYQKAYTDRDLGLTYQTHPGSTAKIMTSLSAYHNMGNAASKATYDVDYSEIIENGRVKEPFSSINGRRVSNNVTMTDAIVKSSNCYFVNLLNDKKLYESLGYIYGVVGARLDGHEGRSNITPYFFYDSEFTSRAQFFDEVNYLAAEGLGLYSDYETNYRPKGDRRKLSRFKGSADYWGIAYGQGHLYASPLNMARVASIVANDGRFFPTRYDLNEDARNEWIVKSGTANLKSDMQAEADKHRRNGINLPGKDEPERMFSKTGTPERTWIYVTEDGTVVESKPNDGWYICSIYSKNEKSPLAIAVRMERLGALGSSAAVKLTAETVLPVLQECGYEIY